MIQIILPRVIKLIHDTTEVTTEYTHEIMRSSAAWRFFFQFQVTEPISAIISNDRSIIDSLENEKQGKELQDFYKLSLNQKPFSFLYMKEEFN